jgi:hypothetical protein
MLKATIIKFVRTCVISRLDEELRVNFAFIVYILSPFDCQFAIGTHKPFDKE